MSDVIVTIKTVDQTATGLSASEKRMQEWSKSMTAQAKSFTAIEKQKAAALAETAKVGQGAFATLSKGLQSIGLPALGAAAIFGGLVAITKNAIQTSAKYNEQVRDLSLVTGTGAEKTSRMLQVLDDFQIGAEDVTTATKALTRQGLAPTVETLAQLSDEYLKINDAQQQNEFILKNLGKSGLQWVNLLKQGKDRILELNDGVNENLILTDKQIAGYEKYRLRMDDVSDSIQGMKVTAGNFFFDQVEQLGAGFERAERIQNVIRSMGGNANLGRGSQSSQLVKDLGMMYSQAEITGQSFEKMMKPLDSATMSYIGMAKAVKDGNPALEGASMNYADLIKSGLALTKIQENYAKSQEEIKKGFDDNNAVSELFKTRVTELKDQLKDGDITQRQYYDTIVKMQEALKNGSFAAGEQTTALRKLEEATDAQGSALLSSLLEQKDASDELKLNFAGASGQISQGALEQAKALNKVAEAYISGKINAQQAAQAAKAVSGDIAALNGLTAETYIDVYIRTHGSMILPGQNTEGTTNATRRHGGEVGFASGTTNIGRAGVFRVGEMGEEGLVVRQDGTIGVIPSGAWKEMQKYGLGSDGGYAGGLAASAAQNLKSRGGTIRRPGTSPRSTGITVSGTSLEASSPDVAMQEQAKQAEKQMNAYTQAVQQQNDLLASIDTRLAKQSTKADDYAVATMSTRTAIQ